MATRIGGRISVVEYNVFELALGLALSPEDEAAGGDIKRLYNIVS